MGLGADSVAEPRHCTLCLAVVHMPLPTFGIRDETRSFKCVRPQKKSSNFQSKLAHDHKSAEDLFFARGFSHHCKKRCPGETFLQKQSTGSRHRRDEALPPGADRKRKEAGRGARIDVDGCQ